MFDQDTKNYAKGCEKELENADFLKREHKSDDNENKRDDYFRDYARVLYSSSFRRLQGKMQLFEIDASKFNRNRLTHSLEVAQIARTIATHLELKHPVVVEVAALAHDIGNPPFGHSGERTLNRLAEDFGGFEGNAQALRILRTLEKKQMDYSGLNLTLRSILSVIKYPYTKEKNNNKFIYNDDYNFLEKYIYSFNSQIYLRGKKTIDAEIMDLSDEIAYAAHDLEDALSRNIVNIDDILYEFKISKSYKDTYDTFDNLVTSSKNTACREGTMNSSEEFSIVFKKKLISKIVDTLCKDIALVINEQGHKNLGYKNHGKLAKGLKKLLFAVIMRKRDIKLYEIQGDRIIEDLYNFYLKGENYTLLPLELKSRKEEDGKTRIVIDYIAGMMDTFAIQEWELHCNKKTPHS